MAERVDIEWHARYTNAVALWPGGPCWHCEKPTVWVDFDFETPLCPGPCSEAKWLEYLQATLTG